MPIYRLTKDIVFPPPEHAEPDGLLAVGGDLASERILLAYRVGIFPWYMEGQPILWWSPDPRLVLDLDEFHVSRRLRQILKKGGFTVTLDQAFPQVIGGCARVLRKGQRGTWITAGMQEAYIRLHQMGLAHSAETWYGEELVGGLYGVSLGRAFFAESMFFLKTDASKIALAQLIEQLKKWNFHMLDAQVTSPHLLGLGAKEIPRGIFLRRLKKALDFPTITGKWEL